MKGRRGRPPIKPSIKTFIYLKALRERNIPRAVLACELRDVIVNKMNEVPLSEETIIKLISLARNHPPSPLDNPFSIASLAEHDIPPEAGPAVMSIYKKLVSENEGFSIGEAQWVARLYKIIEPPELVWYWANLYAEWEKISWMQGTTFHSNELDIMMMLDVYYARDNRDIIELLEIDKDDYAHIRIWKLERAKAASD